MPEAAFCFPLLLCDLVLREGTFGGIGESEAKLFSLFGTTGGAGSIAGKSFSSSESSITITSWSNGLEERKDGAQDDGIDEARLLGREPTRENGECTLEGARELTKDVAREGARELKSCMCELIPTDPSPIRSSLGWRGFIRIPKTEGNIRIVMLEVELATP
ncbi:hypothetical protein B0H17DRAFT_1133730 [Mycena rosella]|uniref:Uncharacterized protein n=1 Tax=Mycena rosella TaxID=1033263 RepID=A0AAD7GEN7_MYCRO|nr:hypothetical protein B0H17DRAFT_1133730 [Mycena rosella]